MTTKRRAEIQRRLSLAPVPKPPDGLADRIKNDIPKELRFDADRERARLRQSVAFNIRVAASIILLVSSVYLALRLLSRSFGPTEYDAVASKNEMQPAAAQTRPSAQPELTAAKEQAAPPASAVAPQAMRGFRDERALPNVEICVAPFNPAKNIVRVTTPKAEVKFNNAVVASSRKVSPEVYEITLRRRAALNETIATVRADGVEHNVRRADVHPWKEASREMKSVSLTLALEEDNAKADDVLARARAAGLEDVAADAAARKQH